MKSELADLIAFEIGNAASGGLVRVSADGTTPVFESDDRLAAKIIAAGYRKPRTVTTVDELDALPIESVILDRDGDAWQRSRAGWTCTDRALNTQDQPSSSLAYVLSPATVIHEGQA